MRFTIYTLADPRTGEVRYVGMTSRTVEQRLREHLKDGRTRKGVSHRLHWLRQLVSEGLEPAVAIIEETTEELWAERERHWIAKLRDDGCALTNHTDGGEGVLGHRHSDETRAKIREKRAQQVIAPEHIARMAEANIGNKHSTGPKPPRTTTHRERLSASLKGREFSEESRARMAEAARGRTASPETRAKMSVASKGNQHRLGKCHSPESRAKIGAAHRGKSVSAETRTKMSVANKGKLKGRSWSVDPSTGKRVWSPSVS
jgi:hypothetical protein